jgi:TonB family protein
MFEYVKANNQRRLLTGRIAPFFIISCAAHALMVAALIRYPQLLEGGMLHRFRVLSMIAEGLMPKPKSDDNNWRTVTVLRPQSTMQAPSMEQLKKLIYDWSAKPNPPIRVRWGDEQKEALKNNPPPKVTPQPKLPQASPTTSDTAGAVAVTPAPGESGNSAAQGSGSGSYTARIEPGPAKRDSVNLPQPGAGAKTDTAANTEPKSIPDGVKPGGSTPGYKVFDSEQKAITSPDSGFFGTMGFPLGEYANMIKERIKGNWNIPSNLQNFQGHTTVVFYIDKDGRYANARIVTSSGSSSFDMAALAAVIDSDPFPPLPKGFPGNHIGAKFVLSWNE